MCDIFCQENIQSYFCILLKSSSEINESTDTAAVSKKRLYVYSQLLNHWANISNAFRFGQKKIIIIKTVCALLILSVLISVVIIIIKKKIHREAVTKEILTTTITAESTSTKRLTTTASAIIDLSPLFSIVSELIGLFGWYLMMPSYMHMGVSTRNHQVHPVNLSDFDETFSIFTALIGDTFGDENF